MLFELFPALQGRVPWVSLGRFPTALEPVEALASATGELWLKRDDLSSPVYGGNKVRMLEHLLGAAQQRGARHVYATGAVGSNFVLATALHAERVGITPGALCFPQPLTPEAERNHRLACARADIVDVAHWSLLPLASRQIVRRHATRGETVEVLSQVGSNPETLFGYLGAGLELARQIAGGECPPPARIVLPIGSAATSAGVLAGLSLARSLGILPRDVTLSAVRIAPFPLSRRGRVIGLAARALRRLAELTSRPEHALDQRRLLPLELVTDQLGAGYAVPTDAGRAAREAFVRAGYPLLDDTYTAKAAAHVLSSKANGPTVLWCTKSSAPLP